MNSSPYARDPLSVELNGAYIRVPYRSAAEWVSAILDSTGPSAVLSGLAGGQTRELLLDGLASGETTSDALAQASYSLFREAAPAWSWWETYRLLHVSADKLIAGRLALAGMDPWSLTVAQWVSGVYVVIQEDQDQKDQFRFDASLSAAPEGVEDDDWGDMSFDQMVASARSTPGFR